MALDVILNRRLALQLPATFPRLVTRPGRAAGPDAPAAAACMLIALRLVFLGGVLRGVRRMLCVGGGVGPGALLALALPVLSECRDGRQRGLVVQDAGGKGM